MRARGREGGSRVTGVGLTLSFVCLLPWLARRQVSRFVADHADLEQVEAMLAEAEREGIPDDHPDVVKLREHRERGLQWNTDATRLMAEGRRHRFAEWEYAAAPVASVVGGARAAHRGGTGTWFPFRLGRALLERGQELVVSRAIFVQVHRAVTSTENWISAVKKCAYFSFTQAC